MAPYANTADIPDSFFPTWIRAFKEDLKMNPLDPLCAAMNESGLYAKAHNPNGNASGLIQFMPDTLKGLGYKGSWSDFVKLPADQQVPYVKAYYSPHSSYCTSPGLCYVTTFLPALTPAASKGGPSFVLARHGGTLGWAYDANPGFDHAKKGYITVQDLEDTIANACKGARWDEIFQRYNDAYNAAYPPDADPAPAV